MKKHFERSVIYYLSFEKTLHPQCIAKPTPITVTDSVDETTWIRITIHESEAPWMAGTFKEQFNPDLVNPRGVSRGEDAGDRKKLKKSDMRKQLDEALTKCISNIV